MHVLFEYQITRTYLVKRGFREILENSISAEKLKINGKSDFKTFTFGYYLLLHTIDQDQLCISLFHTCPWGQNRALMIGPDIHSPLPQIFVSFEMSLGSK